MAINPHPARLRRICLALPEAHEKLAWGAPTFRVRNKLFVHYRNNHHGDGRIAAWCKSLPEIQMDWVELDPELFFVPPYVGPVVGWVSVWTGNRSGRSFRASSKMRTVWRRPKNC